MGDDSSNHSSPVNRDSEKQVNDAWQAQGKTASSDQEGLKGFYFFFILSNSAT